VAAAAFTGTVIDVTFVPAQFPVEATTPSAAQRLSGPGLGERMRIKPGFRVVRMQVGDVLSGVTGQKEIEIVSDLSDCGYPFEVGHEYLVFANEFQGNLTVTTCSATQPAKMAVSTIQQLRTRRDGTALPGIFGAALTHPAAWSQTGWEQVQPVPGLTVTARAALRAIRALRPRFAPLWDDVQEQVFRQIDEYTGCQPPAKNKSFTAKDAKERQGRKGRLERGSKKGIARCGPFCLSGFCMLDRSVPKGHFSCNRCRPIICPAEERCDPPHEDRPGSARK